jgi:ubiquitin-like protein Pup
MVISLARGWLRGDYATKEDELGWIWEGVIMTQSTQEERRSIREDNETEVSDTVPGDITNPELGLQVDSVLDEIEGVLEANAEEFVRSYIQKGGQ